MIILKCFDNLTTLEMSSDAEVAANPSCAFGYSVLSELGQTISCSSSQL